MREEAGGLLPHHVSGVVRFDGGLPTSNRGWSSYCTWNVQLASVEVFFDVAVLIVIVVVPAT